MRSNRPSNMENYMLTISTKFQTILYNSVLSILFVLLSILPSISQEAEGIKQTFLDINVKEMADVHLNRSVTGGVPLAEGAAPKGSHFVLLDASSKMVPCQTKVLATWNDGSARWVLLDFQANPEINSSEDFRLAWHSKIKSVLPTKPVVVKDKEEVFIRSGDVQIQTIPGSLLRISNRFDVKLTLINRNGERCEGIVESSKVETKGHMRSTLVLSGSFRTPAGKRVVDFGVRTSVYAGLSHFYLEPQILVNADTGIITHLQELSLEILPIDKIKSSSIGGSPGWSGTPSPDAPVRLFQVDDENYRIEGTSGSGGKAPGWVEFNDGKGPVALTLRDFWQQWPKSLEVSSKVIKLGLFPHYKSGTFDHMEPWYKYDYLFENHSYRLREGQSRRWQIWIDLLGKGDALTKSVNKPLIPAADPEQAIATGEWGFIAPAGSKEMAEYDTWAENLFEGYRGSIQKQRDYGAMNWGDWWGERGVNWGNHEYDTPLHILTQFARTGDPKYYYIGSEAARHYSEVDVVHSLNEDLKKYFSRWESPRYPSRPGMVHEHSIGHVGGFHSVEEVKDLYVSLNIGNSPNPYLCLDPYNLGHIFTLGMAHYYLLSGDPWVKETIERIGDNLMKLTEDGLYKFKGSSHSGRVNGWTMLALAGDYKINPSDRCLKAMQRLADDALSEQNPNCGGWLYSLPWGHCNCVPVTERNSGALSHVGEATFISSVRLNGLAYYYHLTGDQRIPESIMRGVTYFNNDTWNEQRAGWRYTSCPATMKSTGQGGTIIMSLVNSISLNQDQEQMRIFRKAWNNKFARLLEVPNNSKPGSGKSYSQNMYGAAEAANLYINGINN